MVRPVGIAVLALTLIVGACGDAGDAETGPLVVATTSIWGEVAAGLLGDDGRVEVLIPVGADAHDFQVSARQAAMLHEADLVVANGLGLEAGLADVLESAAADGANVFEVAPRLDPLPLLSGGALDPHVWMDPLRVAAGTRLIATELDAIADGQWRARAEAGAAALEAVDADIRAALDAVPPQQRKLVTNHEALGYFASAYGFEVIGVVIAGGSTLAEPSSAELAALVATIRTEGVTAVFAETVAPSALADAVAAELDGDVQVVDLYTESLGEPGSGADTVAGMLLTDARRIAEALS